MKSSKKNHVPLRWPEDNAVASNRHENNQVIDDPAMAMMYQAMTHFMGH